MSNEHDFNNWTVMIEKDYTAIDLMDCLVSYARTLRGRPNSESPFHLSRDADVIVIFVDRWLAGLPD